LYDWRTIGLVKLPRLERASAAAAWANKICLEFLQNLIDDARCYALKHEDAHLMLPYFAQLGLPPMSAI